MIKALTKPIVAISLRCDKCVVSDGLTNVTKRNFASGGVTSFSQPGSERMQAVLTMEHDGLWLAEFAVRTG
jgi:hypothetical protein